jgi:hypothetical protein
MKLGKYSRVYFNIMEPSVEKCGTCRVEFPFIVLQCKDFPNLTFDFNIGNVRLYKISCSGMCDFIATVRNFSGDVTVCNFVENLMSCYEIRFVMKWDRSAIHRHSSGRAPREVMHFPSAASDQPAEWL